MIISKKIPNVVTYSIKMDLKEDKKLYQRCKSLDITLDFDSWIISCNGDCGHWSYQWMPDNTNFLDQMCRINGSYLLDKIASRSVFNLKKSKDETIKNVKRDYPDDVMENEVKDAIKYIKSLQNKGKELFYEQILYNFEWMSVETICSEMEYPAGAVVFCEIFEQILQPILKKELKIKEENYV